MTDMIRKSDALAILTAASGMTQKTLNAIAELPAVTVGADAVLDAAHEYLTQQYGASPLGHPIDRARILAALEPVAAPDYRLAPHLQRIVEGAKTAPQWDTVRDRMAAPDPTEYERKVAQMKEDFPNGI